MRPEIRQLGVPESNTKLLAARLGSAIENTRLKEMLD